jgi:nucleoside 2-deoxyribosyltransferase
MINPLVYLAGPIAGLAYGDATDWRAQARAVLRARMVETLNPMRSKGRLDVPGAIAPDFHQYAHHGAFFTSRGIMTRDHTDVMRADALLVNLLGATRPSLGTVMELAWAFAYRKPVVVAIEASGNVHDNHPMIHEAIGFRVETLDEAIDAVAVILNR